MRNSGIVFVPESPTHSGLYANECELNKGKVSKGLAISTHSIECAKQFKTKSECDDWCVENPVPKFNTVEHEFI